MKNGASAKITSNFINAGLTFQFLPRVGFTAGFQMINTDYGTSININPTVGLDVPFMKSNQTQWMVGFDYTVADNAWLAINYGMINVKNDYNTLTAEGEARNLPDYYDGTKGVYTHKFSQSIFEASINVEF